MKFTGTGKSGNDVTVYQFVMGKQEARLIHDLLNRFTDDTKGVFEAQPARNRARTIMDSLQSNVPIDEMSAYEHSEEDQ